MSAEAASFAVLGADVEALGLAVARHWGLDESVLQMIRRLPLTGPVHHPEGDAEILRATASCANELVDALALPARRVNAGLSAVASRYARALGVSARDMQEALQQESAQPAGAARAGASIPANPANPATPTPPTPARPRSPAPARSARAA